MKLELQNIGGIVKEKVELKEGLNAVTAPNAMGKTSFITALKVAVLSEKEIKDNTRFLNDFANSGFVEIDGKNRTIRRHGNELGVVGKPVFNINSKSQLVFAEPDNEFLDDVIKGRDIGDFIEGFSDAKHYKKFLESGFYDASKEIRRTLVELNDKVRNRSELQKEHTASKKELDKLEKELDKLKPQKEKIDATAFGKKTQEKKQLDEKVKEIKDRMNEIKGNIGYNSKELPKLKKEVSDSQKEIDKFDTHSAEKKIEEYKKEIEKNEELVEQVRGELSNIKLQIRNVEGAENLNMDICSECGRPYDEKQRRKRKAELYKSQGIKNKELEEYNSKIKITKIEMDNLRVETDRILFDLTGDVKTKSNTITECEKQIREWQGEQERRSKDLEKFNEKLKELKKDLDMKSQTIIEKYDDANDKVGVAQAKTKQFEISINDLTEIEKEFELVKARDDFLKDVKVYAEQEIKRMKDAVKTLFNKRISEVYNLLGFKNFDSISIDEGYNIVVRRKGKMQNIDRLATSERVTIGVIVMLAGKEEYLPDFPFFILDEITTAYDPVRFSKIINYIKDKTLYTIVSTFSPSGDKIKVEAKL